MPVTAYRVRWPVAIGTSATVPLVGGVLLALVVRPVALGVLAGVLFALGMGATLVVQVRRRALTVHADALVVQRDQYRLVVPWSGVTAVRTRRHQRVLRVEELVCSGAQVIAVDSRGRPSRLPRALEAHPGLTRVQVSLYDRDWRSGPVGERLRAAGLDV